MLNASHRQRLTQQNPLLSIGEIGDPVLAGFPTLDVEELPGSADLEMRESEVLESSNIVLSRKSTAFGEKPWYIGVHVPADAVSEQFKRLAASIAISLGLLLVSVAAALLLAKRIARPIRAVSAAAGKIERLELDGIAPLPPSRIREIDEQARSFNQMLQALRWLQAYMPQQLVHRLMKASEGPATGARETELTVMFADIAGFTPMSEAMPPADVARLLNRHFEMLNGCIEAEDGTLDKYIGDAVMAFWGAPEHVPDHAARACKAALAIAEAVEERAARDVPAIRLKIALHTGPLIVGNIGAPTRMNYTVIGDTVNVCSRIASLSADFTGERHATILVSGSVVASAGNGFRFEPIGERTLKGREQSITVWRLVGQSSRSWA